MWLYLTLSLLSLAAYPPTEACSCPKPHLQSAFCNSDFVIMAKFLGNPNEDESDWIRHGVKVYEAMKGGEEAQKLDVVYSRTQFGCAYRHDTHDYTSVYVIAGKMEDGRAVVDSCSFIKLLHELIAGQVMGIRGTYQQGCDCIIVPCLSGLCDGSPSSNQCFWDQYGTSTTSQEVNERCAKNEQGNCAWMWAL
uniref:Metalloproteinase inhibitor 1 n=1 Tax=Plethodon cinereus TaxID=141976 RepID=W8PW40_9SALA|nr:C3 variant 1 [Plethodon cinereus]AHL39254.1 C3 variant 2 [Plethodon cinereus]AHL39256.1 C3 variant 4 [Plethodon cinereus]AHL39259.1 C3 variant 7 [Plethodon cinereus]